ncbi:MAG: TonB-dependent receptor, partial [Acidobacteriota bacterium]
FVGHAISLAQTTGDIEGQAADPSGTPLPGVTIEARSPSLQGTRVAVSGREGAYRLPGLPPGVYRVRATLASFDSQERTATVSLDATATVDFRLRLSTREEVIVSGAASLVDVTSTETGTTYTSDVIARLPVARNYADIVRSNPGVTVDRGETQGRSLALAIYGATSVENQWIIDGINTTNVMRGSQGKAINNEFVEEVQVKTGGYQAEYGRALGGVVNVITKSGGNSFHGDAFAYYDSDEWKADERITDEDFLAGRMVISDYRRTDLGVDLGGYLVKDRLWFFGAYNRIDLPAEVSRYESSPLVPSTRRFPLEGTDNLYSGKLTWNVATGSTVVATIFADPTVNSGAGRADPRQGQANIRLINNPDPGTWESKRSIGATDFGVRLSQLFGSAALLTVQGARHRDRYELDPSGAGSVARLDDLTCVGGTPEEPCHLPPVANLSTGGLGLIGLPRNKSRSRRNQYRADLNLYVEDHEIKLGGDYDDAATEAFGYYTGGQHVYRLNEFGQVYYAHEFYARSRSDLVPVDRVAEASTRNLGFYLQDSWKLARGWALNAGIRWDEQDVRAYGGRTVFKTTNEWQPRLGVVWDPGRNGRTKLYGFAGRFYYALPTVAAVRSFSSYTDATTFNSDPVSVVHDPNVLGHPEPFISGNTLETPVDEGLKGGYQDELTVGVERLLDPTFSVALKGTYRRLGRVIEDRCDLDYSAPVNNESSCGIFNPGSDGSIARGAVPGCNSLDGAAFECSDTIPAIPRARRIFRGVEVLARKSFDERLWLQASYLYSSLRGNYDGGVLASGQTDPGVSAAYDYPGMLRNSYGRLYLDRPHNLRLDAYYATRFKLFAGVGGYVQSGAPLSRIGYLNQFGAGVHLVQNGTEGRLPTLWEANLTLGYSIRVGPATVTIQAYVFNLFDNQIATSRDEVWSDQPPPGYPASLFDPNQPKSNLYYGKTTSRQEPRLVRGAVKISF